MVRGALALLISMEHDLEIVADVANGDEVLPAALRTGPDVALIDIEMPRLDGFSVATLLARQASNCKVIILTMFCSPGYVRRAMKVGAAGFLAKEAPSDELASAIRRVHAGELVVDPILAASALRDGDSPLTDREAAVLAAAGDGLSVAQIADSMRLAEGTTRNYLSAAIRKLDAPNRIAAAAIAKNRGWI